MTRTELANVARIRANVNNHELQEALHWLDGYVVGNNVGKYGQNWVAYMVAPYTVLIVGRAARANLKLDAALEAEWANKIRSYIEVNKEVQSSTERDEFIEEVRKLFSNMVCAALAAEGR